MVNKNVLDQLSVVFEYYTSLLGVKVSHHLLPLYINYAGKVPGAVVHSAGKD